MRPPGSVAQTVFAEPARTAHARRYHLCFVPHGRYLARDSLQEDPSLSLFCSPVYRDKMGEENGHVHLLLLQERPPPPRIRGDCLEGGVNAARPCPWIGCRYNIVEARPDQATCALDVADQGGITLEEVGDLLGVTRERIRQIEAHGLRLLAVRDHSVFRNMLRMLLVE
jgi:Sigma-70, region 4